MSVIVSLVGQQPIPNLLPIRYLKPDAVLLVSTNFTQQAANRLENLVSHDLAVSQLLVDAYSVSEVQNAILKQLNVEQMRPEEVIINLTGGTKPMSLAAYLVAAELQCDFVYLESQRMESRLYRYAFNGKTPTLQQHTRLPDLITADDYLRAYISSYELTGVANKQDGGLFEEAIHAALQPVVDEILVGVKLLGALDVDFVVRCGNQVGIIKAKIGGGKKKGLDQLANAGGQSYLGTYIQKFLVSDQVWDNSLSNLKELAEARQVKVIQLPSFSNGGQLSAEDATLLRDVVCQALGKH